LGFTLIELLIVIGILGILAAGVVVAINPLAKINSANLAKTKTFAASVENSLAISQVGKWSFEEQTGTIASDTSGYGNNGTLNNSSMWKSAADPACKDLGFGGCLSFNGTQFVTIPKNVLGNSNAFTASAWAYLTGSGSWNTIVGEGCQGFDLTISSQQVRFGRNCGGGSPFYNGPTISLNRWYHTVIAYDGSSIKLYVDGKLYNGGSVTYDRANVASMNIGSYSSTGAEFFNGFIDEVSIYSQALLSSQIKQLYVQGLAKHQLVYNK